MKIISRFVREQRRYSKNELKNSFAFDEQGVEKFIKTLKAYGILKAVNNSKEQLELSDLVDEDVQIADETAGNDEYLYVFTYVGVITYSNRVVKIYPKYMLSGEHDNNTAEPLEPMKQVMKVLERYSNSEEQIINLFNGDGENRSFNLLAIILFLLNDYHEYGVYNNSEDLIEVNGDGAILWQKTIDEGFALIRDNHPYYTELYTEKTIDDDMDYFKRLHECILTECSKQLHDSQLEELFEMVSVELSEEEISDFGEREYILDRIQAELNVQFNTRRQILLKTMYTYISQERNVMEQNEGVSMFGTTAFHAVWEKICAEVFNNKLGTPIGSLGLTLPLAAGFDKRKKLIEIIDLPEWKAADMDKPIEAKDTLIPDIITAGQSEAGDYFVILDAKYYNIQLEKGKSLRGNPGIGDVTKQYLYQLAYRDFIEKHSIPIVKNCFIMPTEEDGIIVKGSVRLKMLEALGLENIQIRLLPAQRVYDAYLHRKKIPIEELKL